MIIVTTSFTSSKPTTLDKSCKLTVMVLDILLTEPLHEFTHHDKALLQPIFTMRTNGVSLLDSRRATSPRTSRLHPRLLGAGIKVHLVVLDGEAKLQCLARLDKIIALRKAIGARRGLHLGRRGGCAFDRAERWRDWTQGGDVAAEHGGMCAVMRCASRG